MHCLIEQRRPMYRKVPTVSPCFYTFRLLNCVVFILVGLTAQAQDVSPFVHDVGSADPEWVDTTSTGRFNLGLTLASTAAVALYGKTNWWQDGFSGHFRTQKEGWFGHNTYSGGADKLGHFYMNYAGTRLLSQAFAWGGNSPSTSHVLAALLVLGTFSGIEILDGYSRHWRFSREDALINAAGAGVGLLLEKNPALDRLIDIRVHYWPSHGSNFDPFGDYSGQTYLLVFKGDGISAWRDRSLLRYLEFSIGYGTRGYSQDRTGPSMPGERNVYVGISLNLSALLDDKVYRTSGTASRTQRVTKTALEFVQPPGTVAYFRRSLD